MKSVFFYKNYSTFIKDWIEQHSSTFGLLSQMAKAIECQNSHLTRVLKEEVHFTMDQAFRLSNFLQMTENESTFFLKIVEYERSGDRKFRERLKREMDQLKKDQENLSKRFDDKIIQSKEFESLYYSSWIWSAIHVITDIPVYQTSEAIAKRLCLEEKEVRSVLEKLETFGLVKRKAHQWIFSSGVIHLPKTSSMNSVQHGNWRSQAVLRSQSSENDDIHYSTVQAVSFEDRDKIKHLLFETIEHYRKIANPSTPEELT